MRAVRCVAAALACVLLSRCLGDDSPVRSPLVEPLAEAATATSLGAAGDCRLDGAVGALFLFLAEEATVYAEGYLDERFCGLRAGMSHDDVLSRLGPPIGETWLYRGEGADAFDLVWFERGRIPAGATAAEVLAARGAPDEITLRYSSRTADTHYRERYVTVVDGRVVRVTAGVYVD